MNSVEETRVFLVIFFVFAIFVLLAMGFIVFAFSDFSYNIQEKIIKHRREKYPYKHLHRNIIKEKTTISDTFYYYLFDILRYYNCDELIIKSTDSPLLMLDKNDLFGSFRYALNLANSGILSKTRCEEVVECVYDQLLLSEKDAAKLEPNWYEQENLCFKNLILLEAKKVNDKSISQCEFLFRNKETGEQVAISVPSKFEIYDALCNL